MSTFSQPPAPATAKGIAKQSATAATEELMKLPPWLQAMRDTMTKSISAEDLGEILGAQVRKAKAGDRKAADFVLNQAHRLMQSHAAMTPKTVTLVQNHYHGDAPRPETPDTSPNGSEARIAKLAARHAAGLPLRHPKDRDPRPVGDEEEKELRRREEEENAERHESAVNY